MAQEGCRNRKAPHAESRTGCRGCKWGKPSVVKKSISDIKVAGARVLVRLDLNVPLSGTGRIEDDLRIGAAMPTLRKLVDAGARTVIMSHMGRPRGSSADRMRLSLGVVANKLSKMLRKPVPLAADCVGRPAQLLVEGLQPRNLCMLENLRFHAEETIKDKDARERPYLRSAKEAFARQIADLGDVYVNDAFGACHRDNASMTTVPAMMAGKPCVMGFLVKRELSLLGHAVKDPRRPFVCLLGGAKVSDKLGVIRQLLLTCDKILVGGAMAYTFLAAEVREVGKSLVEQDLLDTARDIRAQAGDKLVLPVDSVVAPKIARDVTTKICDGMIPKTMMGLDIGPETIDAYAQFIEAARTVVWNGPMGVFETEPFDAGTVAMAKALAAATKHGATTIIGGGDSAAAVHKAGLANKMTHMSTGGGASLEFLEGKRFGAIDILDDA